MKNDTISFYFTIIGFLFMDRVFAIVCLYIIKKVYKKFTHVIVVMYDSFTIA